MNRRSCQEYNLRADKGPKGCAHGYKCKDGCKDYARRNGKHTQWKVPTSLCMHLRYRYHGGVSIKKCAVLDGAACSQECPMFERRVKKALRKSK